MPHPHTCIRRVWLPSPIVVAMVAILAWTAPVASADDSPDFGREVLPILSNHCYSCHGVDEAARQAGLRLDVRDSVVRATDSGALPIVPGDPEVSDVVARITATDADAIMPPPSAKKPLSPGQIDVLRRWIAAGAQYAQHWAHQPPTRPDLPQVRQADWPRGPLDYFILARLEAEGLAPSPEADRNTWLRRVTLDLTGLPPTPEELDAFLADESADAYGRVVDRLLDSPRHAERMAMHWLDAARYADTNGYNNDETRSMWPWRDWVIRAFAEGMPYDQFVTEQIAGDLLPNATLSQRVATGFNRNHVLTTEGGIIEEEYHVEYVVDRVHTTSTVFMATSLQCARCHDHKYDPITQREFYQFAAFFNNVPDRVVGYSQGRMAEPLLKVPSPEQQAELDRLERCRAELPEALAARAAAVGEDLARWEATLTPEQIEQTSAAGLVAHFPLDETEGDRVENAVAPGLPGTIKGPAMRVPGRLAGGLQFDGQTHVEAGGAGAFEADNAFSIAAWIRPTSTEASTVLSKMDEVAGNRGYDVILEGAKVASHFVDHWPDKAFKVVSKQPLSLNEWHHVAVAYDGGRTAAGVKLYIDGQPAEFDVTTGNRVEGSLLTDQPLRIGLRQSSAPFQGSIDDVQLYGLAVSAEDAAELAAGRRVAGLKDVLATPAEQRTPQQQARLRDYYLTQFDEPYRALLAEQAALPGRIAAVDQAIPVTMVMHEQDPPRPSYILQRGQYDQRGEEVPRGVPAALSPFPADAPATRLGLARWMTSRNHPLTARVAVNRWWEMLFGTGIVETSEDFGIQGAAPTHPELLDWLAVELIESGWSYRALLKQIVLSATYRQSSRVTPELLDRDPRNRLLSRGARYRLPGEMVRDSALFAAGLLHEELGGPSVKPYQPEGLWEDVSVERRDKYVPDTGSGLYRRGMYTFWKRTCPPPGMATFDAPDRETCVVRRARTNTPLQALVLLNDPTYVEAARKLAERILLVGSTDDERLDAAYRLVLSRVPRPAERATLLRVRDRARQRFADDPTAAAGLLDVGASTRDPSLDAAELAAWTTLTSVMLNLDEAVTRQ
jgi:hypothetical protein